MPRKALLYVHEYPYHVTARSNNKEWFYLPKDFLWEIFLKELTDLKENFGVRIHAFVLMDNHYHLLLSTYGDYLLGEVMQRLQRSVSRKVNREAQRINHVFGGAYKGCLINNPKYYAQVIKYIYRNPVKAKMVDRVEEYSYSSIDCTFSYLIENSFEAMESDVPKNKSEYLNWLNTAFTQEQDGLIQKSLRKTEFKIIGRVQKRFNDAGRLRK